MRAWLNPLNPVHRGTGGLRGQGRGFSRKIARSGVSILVIEQFARTVLGVADYAAIMLNGLVRSVGRPADIEDELSAAYLGGQKP